MDIQDQAFNDRLREVEAAKSHSRKIGYALFAAALTSFMVIVVRL